MRIENVIIFPVYGLLIILRSETICEHPADDFMEFWKKEDRLPTLHLGVHYACEETIGLQLIFGHLFFLTKKSQFVFSCQFLPQTLSQ